MTTRREAQVRLARQRNCKSKIFRFSGKKMTGPTTGLKKSAAALCIGMGSFSDPSELPGLAHFLEHMVFMGSKKYPSENGFDKFISKHGGFDNAHTDCEHTTFYFEVQRRDFHTALDMFAQFFIDPLMRKKAMKRERYRTFWKDSSLLCRSLPNLGKLWTRSFRWHCLRITFASSKSLEASLKIITPWPNLCGATRKAFYSARSVIFFQVIQWAWLL